MPFVQFLLDRRPAICINVEPIAEWYDPDNLVDALALKYHHHRGYLRNYLSSLRDLEQRGRVQIIATRRLYFGSLYHEAYSYVIWRPVGRATATISL